MNKTLTMSFALIALLFCTNVFGSVNEPLRWELSSGYRNDCLHWHLKDNDHLTFTEHDRDLQFWENSLTLRVIHRDIALFATGSYGAFGKGSIKQRWDNLQFTTDSPIFSFSRRAWNADGWCYLGYSVNLTDNRTYRVILIPMVGYGINYEEIHRQQSRSLDGLAVAPASTYQMTSIFPNRERMCWFGPLLGGLFLIEPGGRLKFEAGYAYHRLHLRLSSKKQYDVSLYNSNYELLSESCQKDKIKVKDKGNLAHSGWGRIDYTISKEWRMGLEAQIQYSASRVLNAVIKNELTQSRTSQRFKVRWTAITGTIVIARTF